MPYVDLQFMRLALEEAAKGNPSPNPHVGAVIVSSDGQILGKGFHRKAGTEHAEIAAIRDAGPRAKHATLYVTLEPCNHTGRTGPCTESILKAGIQRVIVGVRDSNPHVQGGGIEYLRTCGLDVIEVGESDVKEYCRDCIAPWAKFIESGYPFVRLKLATSLDGRIAAPPHASSQKRFGTSRWITSPESRHRVHQMRIRADAVLVGIGTALADDPELTAREVTCIPERNAPVRVVLDRLAELPIASKLVQTARETPTWIVVTPCAHPKVIERLQAFGVRVLVAREEKGRIDLADTMKLLGKEGLVDLLVEGGGRVAGSLVELDLVDELAWFTAPLVLGAEGTPSISGPMPLSPQAAPRFELYHLEKIGTDTLMVLRKKRTVRKNS